MIKHIVLILMILAFGLNVKAQDASKGNFGFGIGLDYGGFGTRFTYLPTPTIGLFGAFGYNLASLGYNFGAQFKLPSKTRATGYFTGMYGYNGVLVVSGSINSKTTYYGPTIGGGIELNSRKNEKNFWSFELLIPFRDAQFQKDIDALKSIGASVSSPLPIAISVGYHIKF